MRNVFWMGVVFTGLMLLGSSFVRAEEGGEHKEGRKEAPKAEAKDGEWTGKATKTQTGLPILEVGEVRYRLKASEKAGENVKTTIEKIGKGDASGEYKAKGVVSDDERGKKWIAVDSLEPVEKK